MIKLTDRDPLIGQVVGGRYEVLRLIGRGGIGSIYEVRNVRLGRSFALKTLTGDAAASAEAIQRFRREAEIVASIKHPHIVEVVDWDELPDGSPCIVMEYLRGEDLASRINAAAPLPWTLIALVADQVLAALAVTHASGIVHRDLKPQNVFLAVDDAGEERVKLLDFGVSKIRDVPSLMSSDSRLIGTPAYMAPEQAEGRTADVGPHTDVWAMSIMLHEMATGVRAFEGPSMPAVLYAICHGEPAPILAHRPDAPPGFVELIADGLARPIGERLADVATMRARLREAMRERPSVQFSPAMRATPPRGVAPAIAKKRTREQEALADTAPDRASPWPMPSPETVLSGMAAATPPTSAEPNRGRSPWVRYALFGVGIAAAVGVAYAMTREANREEPPQNVAVVTVESTEPADAAEVAQTTPSVSDASVVGIEAAVEDKKAVEDKNRPKPVTAQASPIDSQHRYIRNATKALNGHVAPLVACFNANNADVTGSQQIKATIQIGADGHAKTVSFSPPPVDASALGACLRAEILRVSFPTGDRDQTFSIPLRAMSR